MKIMKQKKNFFDEILCFQRGKPKKKKRKKKKKKEKKRNEIKFV